MVIVPFVCGAADSFQPNINGFVSTVAVQPDGKILFGGNFSSVNGVARSYLARLNSDGSLDPTFSYTNAPAAFVNRILISGPGIYVGAGDGLRRYDFNGGLDWNYPMSVATFGVDTQERVILGGQFTRIENEFHRNIARLTAAGALDATFAPAIGCCASEGVFALATVGDSMLVGGKFQSVNATNVVSHFAKINSDGSIDSTFNAAADPLVLALALTADGKIFRLSESTLARQLANGSSDPSFAPVIVDGTSVERFLALAVQSDGKVVVGGAPAFTARFNADGTADTSFTVQTDGAVQAVAIESNGDILLAGSFTQVNGEARAGLARISNAAASTPELTLARCVSGAMVLSWPQSSTNFSLQFCDLGGNAWLPVAAGSVLANGRIWITNSADGVGKFFRLTRQP